MKKKLGQTRMAETSECNIATRAQQNHSRVCHMPKSKPVSLCALHPSRRNTKATRARHTKYKFGPLNSKSVPHKRKPSLETPQLAEAAVLHVNPGEGMKPSVLSFSWYLPPGGPPDSVSPWGLPSPGLGCHSPTNTTTEQNLRVLPTYHRGLLRLPDLKVTGWPWSS